MRPCWSRFEQSSVRAAAAAGAVVRSGKAQPAGSASPLVDNAGTAIESGPPAASAEGQDDDAEPEEEPV